MKELTILPYWYGRSIFAGDISTWSSGWAIWHRNEMTSGAIQPPPTMELLWERTRFLHREVKDLLRRTQNVDWHVFLEETIPKGFKMVAMLSEARAAVVTAIPSIITLKDVSPSTWKGAYGCLWKNSKSDEEKEAAYIVACNKWQRQFPVTMKGRNRSYDETDAVAILTYALEHVEYTEEV